MALMDQTKAALGPMNRLVYPSGKHGCGQVGI